MLNLRGFQGNFRNVLNAQRNLMLYTPEEYVEISEKVRSGEYFRDVRRMIDSDLHEPMTDRYWYILITTPCILIVIFSFLALQSLYPLRPPVPFIFGIDDIVEDIPQMKHLVEVDGEGADRAIQRFLVKTYVKEREEYNIATFDRNQIALEAISTKKVFEDYQKYIALDNPESPIVKYQRHTKQDIRILSADWLEDEDNDKTDQRDFAMQVVYEAILTPSTKEDKPKRWKVDVAFKYEPVKLDEKTGKVSPYGFIVTGYNAKRL